MTDSTDLLWLQPFWLEQAKQWIDHELHQHGVQRLGTIAQPHIRPWSTVLQIPSNAGVFYFKAVIPDLACEAELTQALFRWYPDRVPQILAVDKQRGWLLMEDGGLRLREIVETMDDIHHWESLLPDYAKLQQECIHHVDELLEMGVYDRRLAVLPEKFRELLHNGEAIGLHHPDGLTPDECRQLQNCGDIVAHLCEELAACGIPETLHHGDLHDGNVFVLNGHYRLFDWGDSSISHPFFSVHSAYEGLKKRFNLDNHSLWLNRLKLSYLQVWSDYASEQQLESAFDLTQRLSPIPAALRWLPVISSMDTAARDKYAGAIPELMRELLGMMVV
jgi:hypothetical protein